MKISYTIFLILFSIFTRAVVLGQCSITLVPGSTNSTCVGCNNGTVSVTVSGGTGPYTYSWTNSIPAGTITLAAIKDNTIYEESTSNSNGSGQYIVAGQTNAGFKNRALIAFDIAGNIPSGATITSANLNIRLLFTSGSTGPQTHSLYKILQNWGEGFSAANQPGQGTAAATNDATWLKSFYPGINWTTAGGTFDPLPSASEIVDAQDITYTWSSTKMVSDIQSWLNIPATNFGWLLKSPETGNKQAKRYGSRENVVPGYAPFLIIDYGPTVIGNTNNVSNLPPGTYTVTVTDSQGCTATTTATVSLAPVVVNLKLWIQGYYAGSGSMQSVKLNQGISTDPSITDDVKIELHNPTTYALVEAQTAKLHTNGLVSATFASVAGSYYLAVKHRNSIETWTATPLVCTGNTALYDFTIAANKAFGDNQAQLEAGVWGFYTGDINQDDIINSNDFPAYNTDALNGVAFVYVNTDMNGDGFVDGNDFPVFDKNTFLGIIAIYPL